MKANARKRIIAFRVTESDYEVLRTASDEGGSCVSEVAREAVLNFARAAASNPSIENQLGAIDQKLDRLLSILRQEDPSDPIS